MFHTEEAGSCRCFFACDWPSARLLSQSDDHGDRQFEVFAPTGSLYSWLKWFDFSGGCLKRLAERTMKVLQEMDARFPSGGGVGTVATDGGGLRCVSKGACGRVATRAGASGLAELRRGGRSE